MENTRLKFISQPFGGVVLLTAINFAFPLTSLAQNPTKQSTTQLNNYTSGQALPTGTQRNTKAPRQLVPSATQVKKNYTQGQTVPAATTPIDTKYTQRQAVPGGTQVNTNYTLGGGDRVRVSVFEVPEYSGEYQIPPGGGLNLPLIGSVSVLGLTTEEAAELITQKYSRFLKRPIITINLLSPRPINIFVAGEVTRAGAYSLNLQAGGGNAPSAQFPTLLSALTTAQGITQSADETRVELRRRIGQGPEQVSVVNLKEIRQTGRIRQDLTLRDGDTIYVPTATTIDLADARNLASSSYAADPTKPRTVALIGEVLRPGSYLVSEGASEGGNANNTTGAPSITGQPTLMRALQLAGGITPEADVRNVAIRRRTRTGNEQSIKVDLWKLLNSGDINQDVILQDGDTIVFPTATEVSRAEATQLATTTLAPSRIQVNVVGEVKAPGVKQVQPNTPLNQALLAAGGFNDARASRTTVDLVRLNPDGSVTKREVKVDIKQGINEQTNPILRNNDIVIVNRSGIAKTGDAVGAFFNPFGTVLGIFRSLFGF
ncbi:polysaccharide biosynthesis/export family protein [Brasilonema bromeliae]|uniref:Polysaccharide export protein n=1 Tax=Brasilonema bromeliae SPC951 TaxID=385972 RepID=A0ABX1PE46_9CYAN|nr:polysaccharide biosynthesis/export family protein [Brasilonema bromeliae]NMG21755.1 polysaccharide export protein [Brasilonema bromeliae SPC951]